MSDGGGTVAGESPDKAEQRESAVGGDGKDPRLSVLRDRVDEPTAVFRALAPRTAPEDEPGEPAEPAPVRAAEQSESSAPSETESPSAESSVTEDASETEPVAEETEARAETAPESETEPEAPEAESRARADAEPADAEAEPTADAVADVDTKATAEADDEAKAEADVTDETKADAEADATDEAAAAAESAAPAESWFAARKPAAPRAEEEPEAAADDEPKPEEPSVKRPEEPKAARPAAGPVDQPTAVFKAFKPAEEPKARTEAESKSGLGAGPEAESEAGTTAAETPKSQPVDQPTTALKLPPSLFRPLQGDITQEQPKPQPKPQQQPTPTPAPAPAAAPTAAPAPAAAQAEAPVPPSLAEAERTRQQPMPPRPPLEILAELTNTPPPAPTPLRTTVRRLKIWTPLVVLLLVVFAVVQFVRPLPDPRLVLSASPTYTFEGGPLQMPWPNEGQGAAEVEGVGSLGTYGPQKPAPIASVAKTMTAYVILRDHPIKGNGNGPEIEVDKTAGEQAKAKDESTAPIKEGQTYSEKELLQLLMIPSGNNVARLLARWDAGSEAAFVEKMNAAAKELGMTGSTYTDPSGLQATTVSTPLDQLKLAKAVMQYDVFREIVDMPNVTVDGIPGQIENNNNILLQPGVAGIKTGSSTPAGGNLLWSAYTVVDGQKRRILGIVMGAKDAPQLWQKLELAIQNSLKLIQKAQQDVTSAAVVKKGQVVGYVDDGLGGRTPVVSTKDLKAVGWPGLKVDLRLGDGGKKPPHAAKAGDVVGEVSIGTGTGEVSAPVALKDDLVEPGFGEKLTRLG
ncbi:D-alanyl-D-alanine carboxypeptidase [Streptomyces sp. NPDC059071]|uniref:D-alanyl-D-alanine carboxypeptidase family protein n=1 Tax=unclassified Streptomyces TaxID=2593676 RepID=UPI00365CE452